MNKQNQNDQNKDWSKQQKGSNEGVSGSNQQPGKQGQQGQQGQQGNQGNQNQGDRKQNQDPVEEKSPKASDNRQEDKKGGENRDPEINMPSNEPEKTEKKIPNYE